MWGNTNNTSMTTTTKARDAEFIAICLDIMRRNARSGRECPLGEVIDEALHRCPRCHYVSYDHASRTLHALERHGAPPCDSTLQRLKWLELYNQVKECMEGPRALPFGKALSFVLGFMRPSRFYIDPSRAMRLLRSRLGYHYFIRG